MSIDTQEIDPVTGAYIEGPNEGLTPAQVEERDAKDLAYRHLMATERMKDPDFGDTPDPRLDAINNAKTPQEVAEILALDPNSNYNSWNALGQILKTVWAELIRVFTGDAEITDALYREIRMDEMYRPSAESVFAEKENSLDTAQAAIRDQFPKSAADFSDLGMPETTVTPKAPAAKT